MSAAEMMAAGPDDESRVYVGNLLPRAKEAHLQAQFARFGVIHNIWIARKPPGFAFVQFAKRGDALRAVDECNGAGGLEILGKPVRVQLAGEKKRTKETAGQAGDTATQSAESGKDDQAVATPKTRERDEGPRPHRGRCSSSPTPLRGGSHERDPRRLRRRSKSNSSRRGKRRSRSRSSSPDRSRRGRHGRERSRSASLSRSRSRSRRRRGSSDEDSRHRSPYRSPIRRSRSRNRDRHRRS